MSSCTTDQSIKYFYDSSWELRQPKYNPPEATPPKQTFQINADMAKRTHLWARYVNGYLNSWYLSYGTSITWFSLNGIAVCKSNSWHRGGRAVDLSQIKFTNGHRHDPYDWESSNLSRRRRYLAIAALTRVYYTNTLTGWYDDDPAWSKATHGTGSKPRAHANHIHFDNEGTTSSTPKFRTNSISDVSLMQAACNNINNEALKIDGRWGTNTSNAYERLRTRLNLTCKNPKTSGSSFRLMLAYIAIHGLADQRAGWRKAAC